MKALCLNCNIDTNHKIIAELPKRFEFENGDIWVNRTWQIIECNGCENISFRETIVSSEDYMDEEGNLYESVFLYPNRNNDALQVKNYYNVPYKIRNIYREMIDAFNNKMYVLCSGGLRAIVEGICNNENIPGDNLQQKITNLAVKGVLTPKHADILHEHRFLGNDALHSLEPPSNDELKLAIEIIEHILDNVYEIEEKVKALKVKKEARTKT